MKNKAIIAAAVILLFAALGGHAHAQAGFGGSGGGGGANVASLTGVFAANVNLTGSDATAVSTGNAKFTLAANESLTINSGTPSPAASATLQYPWMFQVCQGGAGNYTLAFVAGTGVSNIYWSGGSQPGYTLTLNYGDYYACWYDGTNLRCRLSMANQPC
jgi:hypothetical protein